jgi:hypothetical protein
MYGIRETYGIMKSKKHGMKHEKGEGSSKEGKKAHAKMEAFEKAMHGKGYQGYKGKK